MKATATPWNNLSVEGCVKVLCVLREVDRQTGSLPGGKSPDELLRENPYRLLDCAQAVSRDDGIWAQMLEVAEGVKREELRLFLAKILAELH